jgi:undecaprenyl phosphate N,N'-diacetylbacillosamine 1-phosphate transferase
MLKRLIDLSLAIPALIFFSPIIVLMAILVRIDSPGNPFFVQIRVGEKGKHFKIYKIRSLYTEHFGIVPDQEEPDGYRITRVGKYLRRSKLDELPQLFNVILGQMSLVGPRPDIPEQVCNYTPFQKQRLSVKPGLTGISQISGNTLLPWSERIMLDIWYINNQSLLLDFKIMRHTPAVLLNSPTLRLDPFGLHRQIWGSDNAETTDQATD